MGHHHTKYHDHSHSHGHSHGHDHGNGNVHDQGFTGFFRYISQLPRMWRSAVSDAVVALIAPQAGEMAVEIGAGMGAAAVVAVRLDASIVAVDPTPYMRRILNFRRWFWTGRRRVLVKEGSAESIPVADGAADALWTVNTMHHWVDMGRAISEIHRVLRVGGRLLLVDEDFEDPMHPEYSRHQARLAEHHHPFSVVDPIDLAERFRRAGFRNAEGSFEIIADRPCRVIRGVRMVGDPR